MNDYTTVSASWQDLRDSVARIALYMDSSLTPEVVEKIADHCMFKNMKQNKMSNYSLVPSEFMDQTKSEFLRKGTTLLVFLRMFSLSVCFIF